MDDGGFSRREARGIFVYECPYNNSIRDAQGSIEDCGLAGQYCGQCKEDFKDGAESQASKHADAGYMNDMRFGDGQDY